MSRYYLHKTIADDIKGALFTLSGKLEVLDMSENDMKDVQRHIFKGLSSLRQLIFAHNWIHSFSINIIFHT